MVSPVLAPAAQQPEQGIQSWRPRHRCQSTRRARNHRGWGQRLWWNSSEAAYSAATSRGNPGVPPYFQGRGSRRTGFRHARQASRASTAYTERWTNLRAVKTMASRTSGDRLGSSQRSNGSRMREECWNEWESLENPKSMAIHRMTGSQKHIFMLRVFLHGISKSKSRQIPAITL